MADGKITFKTDLDNKDLAKQLKDTENKITKSEKELAKNKKARMPLAEQAEKLSGELEVAVHKMAELEKKAAQVKLGMSEGATPGQFIDAAAQKKEVEEALEKQTKEVEKLDKQYSKVAEKVEDYDNKIKDAEQALKESQEEAGRLAAEMNKSGAETEKAANEAKKAAEELAIATSNGGVKVRKVLDGAEKSLKRFNHRILTLGKRILIFSAVANAFRAIKRYMSTLLSTNQEYQQQLANIKGNLMTAFQPIYEYIIPGLLAVLKIINAVTAVIANVISSIFGKTAKQSAENAKALNKEAKAIGGVGSAAKEASKSLASFDEINKLDSQEQGGGGGVGGGGTVGANFDQWTSDFKSKIDKLTAILSGSLLALGAILTFSDVNIPLGIGLMAAGAIGLVAVAKDNWGLIVQKLRGPIGAITALVSGALLVLGAILAFGGVSLPLGLALMAVGAAGLATTVSVNWSTITTALQGEYGVLMAIISGTLLVLGIILLFTGAGTGLGIGLILAGAAGLATVVAVNWDFLTDKVREIWGNIKSFWNSHIAPVFTKEWWTNKFQSIADGLKSAIKAGINAAIGLTNTFTSWLSGVLSFNIPALNIGNRQIFGGYSASVNIPQIPYLARGAVLPPNQPFMAMVGDQKHGTNIEAPLDTIKQAVAEVLADGEQNSLLREQLEVLRLILEKCGISIDGRELANIVTKHQRQSMRAYGG